MELAIPNTKRRYTISEYLRLSEASPTKLEYRDGEIIDMAGATLDHNQIGANLIGELRSALKGKPCRVLGSDQRVLAANDRYSYPDVTIFCEEPVMDPRDPKLTIINPRVLIEVLSPTTEASDRTEKLLRYINMPSMREYFLVAQDKARIESYVRKPDGSWGTGEFAIGIDATLKFPCLNISIPLREIYANVALPEAAATS